MSMDNASLGYADAATGDSKEAVCQLSSLDHTKQLIANIEQMRLDSNYSDVTIIIDDIQFPCHKVILAAGSPYFKSMFASGMLESKKKDIEMKQIDPFVFGLVLLFIYTGNVEISANTVHELFIQAQLFQINQLVELCVKYLEQSMNESTCLAAMTLAEAHGHKPMYDYSLTFACLKFDTLRDDEDFVTLSIKCVVDLLKDRRLKCNSEEEVYEAAVRWLDHDIEHRKCYRYKILSCIKFPHINQSYLMDVVIKAGHLSDDQRGRELLDEAVLYHTVPSRRHMLPSYQFTPRYTFPYHECAVLLGGRLLDGLSNEVECYRSDSQEFSQLRTLPFKKRNEFAACAVGDEIYVSGGLRSCEFWKYDPTFDSWLRGANMLVARRRHAMAAVDHTIFVLGGFDEEVVLESIEKWDRKSNKWEEAGRLSQAVENMGFVAFGKNIYLFGGKNIEEFVTNTVQCFDTTTLTCSILQKSLPAHDMCLSACVLDGSIYVVGLEGFFKYTPAEDEWELLQDMNLPRDFVSLAVLDQQLYAFGGRRRGAKDNLYSDAIEKYNPELNTWESAGTLPIRMYSYGCVRILLSQQKSGQETSNIKVKKSEG
ncbi:kelch-like protein 24 [Biomphalaria glabrata]|uniref:Kelch-like protein 24 n=1 Tax=Biomphalaria glabrata TaxID=6526 RepID=A0A2C9JCW5_BIOGL|nr:kelch-like protein 24 [Biomphalaria glabrata]XP_013063619.1 kelch-like protein 24 [Biomphalaria glabrata]XP_013063626.1 kelch-like protein 24 [Biomphalaria glabrata]XP_013063634.1 kelch-like protein 24 [Biomphalaria glabrata]XP_055881446.1 kelch-like protein 24 [Biomphalaria glabrata]XP_055881447.1 kelch-like protein 24 [Biomphalaria glabrata]KAI8739573.1 kelch-like protein 24 [Biomphalaria glabrata]KAI8771838.1 kelch protein 24 [Biomphalaria glabrata]